MLASFHLVTYRRDSAPEGLSRMGLDRPLLARVPGLAFWRLLGTGKGTTMTLSADLRRWALFAVWEDEAALDAFLESSAIPARWASLARETWSVRLEPLRSRGSWSGFSLDGDGDGAGDGPVAVLTRASIRPRKIARFWRQTLPPAVALGEADGVLASVGIGEWPLVRQATFSLWRSADDVQAYAYRDPRHVEVMRLRRAENWYSEELFARFRPYGATGTWDGAEPISRATVAAERTTSGSPPPGWVVPPTR